jgi:hypothetical protein
LCRNATNSHPNPSTGPILSNADIANGLKEALNNGIEKQVSKLTKTDGFFKKFCYLMN